MDYTAGVKSVKVYCIGGGGGSGAANSNFDDSARRGKAGGGGSGAITFTTYDITELGNGASISIGAGGTAGIWGGADGGGAGGTTTFNPNGTGANLTAGGGSGSNAAGEFESNGAGGAGGTSASGHLKVWYGETGFRGGTVGDTVNENGDPQTINSAPLGDGINYGRGGEPHHGGDASTTGNSGYAGGVYIFYDT